ncbi:NUDIX hydrolase [Pseudomonas aeruginosa]|nr:NUDIX hydrolase [Pseudomonas aeruginosa]
MTDNLLSISAACLFDDQGNLLLVRKRGTQAFMLPGGKREPGETPLAALQRELLEELRLPMGASTFEHLGSFQAPAANEANTRVDADIYVARLPHAVCAQAELEELAWLVPGQAQPDNLAPLLRDHVLPALARRAAGKPGNPGRTPDAPRSCALALALPSTKKATSWPFRVLAPIARNIGG